MIGLRAAGISLNFQPRGGVLAQFTVLDAGRHISPLHKAPWVGELETMPEGTPPHIAWLAGDFFCAPFGEVSEGTALHGWPANANWLSFPSEGVTLTLDFKYEPDLLPLLDRLDEIVLAAGGRHYLAKDARMSAAVFRQGYPNWHQFKALKDRIDPAGTLGSLQSDRLGLTQAAMRSSQR